MPRIIASGQDAALYYIAISRTDFRSPVTGITRTNFTFKYRRGNQTSLTTYNPPSAQFAEIGDGLYVVQFSGSTAITNILGPFHYLVSNSSILPFFGEAIVASIADSGSNFSLQDISDEIWNEPISLHQQTGSMGQTLSGIHLQTQGGGSSPTAAQIADAVWDELLHQHNISGSAAYLLSLANSGIVAVTGMVDDTTPTVSNFDTNLDIGIYDTGSFTDQSLIFMNGPNKGISRDVDDTTATGGKLNFDFTTEPFLNSPNNNDKFLILSIHTHTGGQIADAVWNEQAAGHNGVGTFGAAINDIDSDVEEILSEIHNGIKPTGIAKINSDGGI